MAAPTMKEAIEIIKEPFGTDEIEWRISRSGDSGGKVWAVAVPYITSRAVHDRLDKAFDPWGWRNEFHVMEVPGGESGVICRTHYLNPDTQAWEWKENGAGQTDIEPFKGGLSGSEKRSFEQFGGGRYLYKMGDEFVDTSLEKDAKFCNYGKTPKPHQTKFYWAIPALPNFARPAVKAAIVEDGESPVGKVRLPQEYPDWNALVGDHSGKKGINELRNVGVVAKGKGWTQGQLLEWVGKQGVDLSDPKLQYSDFAKLNFEIKKEA